jgi:hypothetical protein
MSYEAALAEAMASADLEEVILDTLELRHPAFTAPARVVRAYQNYHLTLESGAPSQPGQAVEFQACPFEFELPPFEEGTIPTLKITISNVSRELTAQLEAALQEPRPIEVTYRPYLESDPSGPQMDPPFHMTLTKVTVDTFSVTGTASLEDVHNWPFPSKKYTPSRFPGLVR